MLLALLLGDDNKMNDKNGIVRRIDDMGRLVLPKDLRRLMRWNNGDPIQIIPRSEDSLLLRKYNQMLSIKDIASVFSLAFYSEFHIPVAISDENVVLASWGFRVPRYAVVAPDLRTLMRNKQEYAFHLSVAKQPLCKDYPDTISYMVPILDRDAAVGSVVIAEDLHGNDPKEVLRVLRYTAKLMEGQLKV